MDISKISKWLASGLVVMTGVLALAATPSIPNLFSKVEPNSVPQRTKELSVQSRTNNMVTVPRLSDQLGRLKSMPQIGSKSLLETPKTSAPQYITSEEAGRIYGGVIYADNWSQSYQPAGIYSFPVNDGSVLRDEAVSEDYIVTGGVYANGEYHYVSYMSFMGMTFANLYTCNFEDWTITRSLPVQAGAIPQDMAYDPTTGNVYGCFMNDNADGWVLGSLNLETGERRHIKDLDMIILSVGVNSKGEWYGVGHDGNFYRFDKETGDRTLIGSTGRRPMYSASGCFDLQTDRFYWECIEADSKANLYEIDVNTGATTYITTLANNTEMVGMFIPVPEAADDAPAIVTDAAFNFESGSLEGAFTFTMPTMQFDGNAELSGQLGYTILVDDKEEGKLTGTAAPGQAVSVPYTFAAPGLHRISVSTSNEAGRSPVALVETWVGHDLPTAVGNLSLKSGEGMTDIILSWDTPTESVNGGYVNSEEISYDIVRMPGEVKVATGFKGNEFRESIPHTEQLSFYYYTVTPIYNGVAGASASSNQIPIGCDNTPISKPMAEASNFDYFRVVDANGDGETWLYDIINSAARIKYSLANNFTEPMDDWMISPRINLKAGRMYRFAIETYCYSANDPERIEVKLGKEGTPEGLTVSVIPATVITNTQPKTLEGWVSVETDGVYYFGIHALSSADTFYLYVKDVSVDEGPLLGTPGAVTNLKATAADNGALKATISGVAPKKTVDGETLEEITEVRIAREGKQIASLTNVTPGQKFEYLDEQAAQSDNNYTVTVVNSVGAGYEVSTSVYVGHDRPGLPKNVRATHNGDNSVTITWDAPTEGETGGYFDPSALTYTILRANDEVELARGVKELTFTDPSAPLNGYRQEFYSYYVYAQSPAGYGYGQCSNTTVVGKPYKMPFIETFADGKINNDPWDVNIPEESGGYWQLKLTGEYPDAASQDPEGGLVSFIPDEAGDYATLTSGTIDVTDAVNPAIEFWWYYVPDSYDVVRVLLSKDGGEFVEIDDVRAAATKGEAGWKKASTKLGDLSGTSFIQIAFEAYSGTGYNNLHLDNIRVKNVYDHNLAARVINAPVRMRMGEESTVEVNVENNGMNRAEQYTVNLIVNDKVVANVEGPAIEADGYTTVKFKVAPEITWPETTYMKAEVVYDADMFADDNTTDKAEVLIIAPTLPYVNDLVGTNDENGNVTLSWSEPEIVEGSGETVTDGAEEYRAFSISEVGDWWMYDGDGMPTFGISNNTGGVVSYENAGKPQAFMVFNPSAAGIPLEYSDGEATPWAPRTGDQYFASFGSEGQCDNWLISPELPRVAQTISFFVKSVTSEYGYEKFEVYYSTTGTEISDFKRIGDLRSAPVAWSEERVELPEGARYFAIRCVSQDAYVFMVDDITYLPAASVTEELALMGYNIYRDFERLNDTPSMEMDFTDLTADGYTHTYAVSTVYDKGESRLSNTVSVAASGIDDIQSDRRVSVTAGEGILTVKAPEGLNLRIATPSAIEVTRAKTSGNDTYHLAIW